MRERMRFVGRLRSWLRLPRTLRPTREGWWYMVTILAVGAAAANTGNNLLYLVLSMMLAGIVVSGFLSEQSLRGIQVRRELAGPVFAERQAFGRLLALNCKRRLQSFSLRLSEVDRAGSHRLLAYLPHLEPRTEQQIAYQTRFERRGPTRLPAIRTTTAFPFGLFVKATRPEAGEEVLVLPRIDPLPVDLLRALGEAGVVARPVRGLGAELHDLRPFRVGDDPRLIHWKQSAKLDRPIVKELESEESRGLTLLLDDPPRPPREPGESERLEQDIRFAGSLVAQVLRAEGSVRLRHRDGPRSAYRGEDGLLRFLEYLARYAPPDEGEVAGPVAEGNGALRDSLTVTIWLGRGLAVIHGPQGKGGRFVRIAPSVQGMAG